MEQETTGKILAAKPGQWVGCSQAAVDRVDYGRAGPDGSALRTFAILTTTANATMSVLHERVLVILESDAWSLWLGDIVASVDLMRPAGDEVLQLWPVSRAVNIVRNTGAELLDRVNDPNAPTGANPAWPLSRFGDANAAAVCRLSAAASGVLPDPLPRAEG